MKKLILVNSLLLVVAVTINARQSDFPKLTGPYLGQKLPGMTPEIFAPGIVSTGMSELNSVFSPDGREFYFCVRTSPTASIFRMQLISGRWSKPDLLPFASRYGDLDVSISVDGARLFFCSKRPVAAVDSPRADHDIWMSLRKGESWGEPIHLGQAVNSNREDFYPTTARNGNLYFNSQREGEGTNNIYVSRQVSGKYTPAEKLGPEINIGSWNFDPCIDPDERFLIFSSNRSGGFGASDLYISFRHKDGSWTPAKNMGGRINTVGPEFCAMLSPGGKFLFFTSSGRSAPAYPDKPLSHGQFYVLHNRPQNPSTDIYWIDANTIQELRPIE